MRHFKLSTLAIAFLASSATAQAQTGDFAATVPGSVVHAGYGLQDWWQELRNGKQAPPPAIEAVQDPVIILPPQPAPAPAKPKKTAKKVTAASPGQPKQQQ
jgi:hypothetical protein